MDRTGGEGRGDDERDLIERQREDRRRQDHEDFHNEMAGRDVGRIRRFLPEDHPANPRARDRKERRAEGRMTVLQAMLADPSYAALYTETLDLLQAAEAKTETALTEAREALAEAESTLEETLDNASVLPNGTRVFRDRDGNVYTEDGGRVTGDDLEAIVWRPGSPSYEEFKAAKRAVDDARSKIDVLLLYQTDVLGHARDRLNDPDNPPTEEELRDIQDRINEGPQFVHEPPEPPEGAPKLTEPGQTASVKLPPLSG